LFGLGVQYIGLLFLTGFATTIAAGSVSVMTFAQNLQGMLLALIGMSYAVATFPTLSRVYAEGNIEEFASKLNAALRHIIFWSLPAIALVIVLRAHIVRTVLGAARSYDSGGNRKHLHFAIHLGKELQMLGYVQQEKELETYRDPSTILPHFSLGATLEPALTAYWRTEGQSSSAAR
jgi:hypothetical protein